MLEIIEFDPKTRQVILEPDPENQERLYPKIKEVENAYLEHWLKTHRLEAQFSVAKFYEGVTDADRQRIEAEGKVLVFSNSKDGYFTDPETARLMTQGDAERGIHPIYSADRNSPHNLVAYGSLISSDGMSSTVVPQARILVIDDEKRSHGNTPLVDRQGKPIPPAELEKLYDKMGDGTMLVPRRTMEVLITGEEREALSLKVFEKHQIDTQIGSIAQDLKAVDQAQAGIEREIQRMSGQISTQFRAATPSLTGIAKGTMTSSQWCERLGVDAIISRNDIKGDDGRFSEPGLKEVANFWVNRKSDGEYGEQVVGPQVKGCIPEATLQEFNPRMKAQAEQLESVARDPVKLRELYVEQKDKRRKVVQDEIEPGLDNPEEESTRADWLYEMIKADIHGVLNESKMLSRDLNRFIRQERMDNAMRGIYVPSAMAQHHSQLEPWEVCHRDLEHGAIVAYYRSPFPNVGAAAIAINNTEILKEHDRESFSKQGVAYLNPWTAKHIAITDFDKDANGYFVGYLPAEGVKDLPQQIRQAMQSVKDRPLSEQYEAGRALFAAMIQGFESGQENRIKPGDYPMAVAEIIDRNAPDRKPAEITKQKKIKHSWQEGESHSAATWRAWSITAENPTGRVANAGMVLQSLALECDYTPPEQKEALLRDISRHHSRLLRQAAEGKLDIPSDHHLQERGFPAYHFAERMKEIGQAGLQLNNIPSGPQRQHFIDNKLQQVKQILGDLVDGPCAENLQTAVDTAKSSRGIDETIQTFAKQLAHKPHELRKHYKDQDTFLEGKTLPTNTQEPIGWGVDSANQLYLQSQAQQRELDNETFRSLIPSIHTGAQLARAKEIASTYNGMIAEAIAAKKRLAENRPEDQQPTLVVTVPKSQSQVVIQRLCEADPQDVSPLWEVRDGAKPDWEIRIERNLNQGYWNQRDGLIANLVHPDADGNPQVTRLGFVSPQSAEQYDLANRLQDKEYLPIKAPITQLVPPFKTQNDSDPLLARAGEYLQESIAAIPPEERKAYASAFWHHSNGMKIVPKQFLPELTEALQTDLELTVTGLQYPTNEAGHPNGEFTVCFRELNYLKKGVSTIGPSISLVTESGQELPLGTIEPRSLRFPLGTQALATIATPWADELTAKLEGGPTVVIEDLKKHDLADRAWNEERGKLHFSCSSPQGPTIAEVILDGQSLELGKVAKSSLNAVKPYIHRDGEVEAILDRPYGKTATVLIQQILSREQDKEVQQESASAQSSVVPVVKVPQAMILPTTAGQCLYGFVNGDGCDTYQPQAANVLQVMESARERGLRVQCERLEKDQVAQTLLTIDFPNAEALEKFTQEVCPLPIQYRYDGDWSGGFQFLEPSEQEQLAERKMIPVPTPEILNAWAGDRDPQFTVSSLKTAGIEVASVNFTQQDHSFARFCDLEVLDIDQPFASVVETFQKHCQSHPDERWAIYSTLKGVHAMRLDVPQAPHQVNEAALKNLGVDPKYLAMCQGDDEWTARVTAKSGRVNDRLQFEQMVGTGAINSELLSKLKGYQQLLIENGLDAPESLARLESEAHSQHPRDNSRMLEQRTSKTEPATDRFQIPDRSREVLLGTSQVTAVEPYAPTRQELLEWLAASKLADKAEQTGEIIGLGRTLRNLYNLEHQTSGETPPSDYRHVAVTISAADRLIPYIKMQKNHQNLVRLKKFVEVAIGVLSMIAGGLALALGQYKGVGLIAIGLLFMPKLNCPAWIKILVAIVGILLLK